MLQLSLRTKVIGLVLFCLLLVGAGSLWPMLQMQSSFHQVVESQFRSLAQKTSESLKQQLSGLALSATSLAGNETLRSMDPLLIEPVLTSYLRLYPQYEQALVVNTKGQLVSFKSKKTQNESSLKETQFGASIWFKAVMDAQFSMDLKGGDPAVYFEATQLGYGFSAPLKDINGRTVGVLNLLASSAWIQKTLKIALDQATSSGFAHTEIVLSDKNQNILEQTGSGAEQPFLSAQASIEPEHWTSNLGWSLFVKDGESEVFSSVHTAMTSYVLFLGFCILLSTVLSIFAVMIFGKTLDSLSQRLARSVQEIGGFSRSVAGHSSELAQAATEQSAALQQTVTAVDEISAMVAKNAESAEQSSAISQESKRAAQAGSEVVQNMVLAIQGIEQASQKISTQMDQNNEEMSKLAGLIHEISAKTSSINEIVFQTKLLSFNASVEAARAGEAGKGFAVVAEEVGNLAQMSGSAAQEISKLLQDSVQKVQTVVAKSKARVAGLNEETKSRVKVGVDTAEQCAQSLHEILGHVDKVDSLVKEIATASTEQSTGIQEISKAMNLMDSLNRKNSNVAESSSRAGLQLEKQSEGLGHVIQDLRSAIQGGSQVENSGFKVSPGQFSAAKRAPSISVQKLAKVV